MSEPTGKTGQLAGYEPTVTDCQTWRAWEIGYCDLEPAYVAGRNAGNARLWAARQLVDLGFARSIGDALRGMTCLRAPEMDLGAAARGRTGGILEVRR